MPKYYSRRNLSFLLYEVYNIEKLSKLNLYKKHNRKIYDKILDAAGQLADKEMYPYLKEMDRNEPQFANEHVKVHTQIRKLMEEFGNGGWISTDAPEQWGGQQLPLMISSCIQFIFGASNYSASVFPFLSMGAAKLITHFGTDELKNNFIPKIYEGKWQGTITMTESNTRSSLADITTSAEPINDEETVFNIKGQKIFISAGDHDGVDNVVHLILARIKNTPLDTKGVSLFVVPQKRYNKENIEEDNDVITTGMFHKMGYKGVPIVQLNMGENNNCIGYLLGEKNKGLSYMSQMMNEVCMSVGLGAVSIASAAYYVSLMYANEKPQGKLNNKDLTLPQSLIIEHADIKRMLLFQKSIIEGSHSLLMQCAYYSDMIKAGKKNYKEIYGLILDLLTSVAKSYPSEMGILSTSAAMQVLGSMGYYTDFPVEQYFREMRIHAIHEGTTGMHGMDLLGRKIIMGGGIAFRAFTEEVARTIKKSKLIVSELASFGEKLNNVLFRFQNITMKLSTMAMKEKKEIFLSDATLYLELFGIVTIAWQWLRMANIAQLALEKNPNDEFYKGKIHTMRYYFEYELPKTEGLIARLNSSDNITLEVKKEHIN